MTQSTPPSDPVTKTDAPAPASADPAPESGATPPVGESVVKTDPPPAPAPTQDLSAIEALIAKSEMRMDGLMTLVAEKNALIEKMQAEIDTLKANNEKLQAAPVAKADTGAALADILKSVPDVVQKALNDLNDRVEKAETEARRYAEQLEKAEWTKKAEPLAACLPTSAEALGGLLQRVAKHQTDDAAELERLFKAVNAAAGQHQTLFAEIGKADSGTVTAKTRIEAVATDIRKSESGLSQEQAIAKALTLHPELYVDYLTEHRSTAAA